MVYDERILVNKRRLQKEIRVGLPDGTFRCVILIGNVILRQNMVIDDVLCKEPRH